MRDINGNEFKVGCVYGNRINDDKREVMKVLNDSVLYWNVACKVQCRDKSDWLGSMASILHYRELAPDKNGKMLCEGDIESHGKTIINSFKSGDGKTYLILWDGATWTWTIPDTIEFFSRPTDVPNEAAKKKAELLAKADELIAKANEMKQKAEEM